MALDVTYDYEIAKQYTDDEDYVDGDRTGYVVRAYNVTRYQSGEGVSVYYTVDHIATGRGLGSYSSLKAIDAVIDEDRAYVEQAGESISMAADSPLALEREPALNVTDGDDLVVDASAPQEQVMPTPSTITYNIDVSK